MVFTDQYIYISTPKTNNVSYKITPVGNSDLAQYSGIVSNGSPVVQAVLDENGNEDFDDNTQLHINRFNINSVINNKGFIIEANDVIYVSIRVRSALSGGDKFHAGALVSKGSSALGNEFRIGGLVRGSTPVDGHITFASLMATEDNTIVNITNIPSGFVQPNGSSIPSDIILNEGESFILASRTNAGFESKDIIGGLISSDKPIVVNSGFCHWKFWK